MQTPSLLGPLEINHRGQENVPPSLHLKTETMDKVHKLRDSEYMGGLTSMPNRICHQVDRFWILAVLVNSGQETASLC
jgi:hypothetical protein